MGRTEADRPLTPDEGIGVCMGALASHIARLRAERDLLAAERQARRDYTAGKCSESDMVAKWRAVDAAGCLGEER